MLFGGFVSKLCVNILLLKPGYEMKDGRITSDDKDGVNKIHFNKYKYRVSHLVAITGSHSIKCVEKISRQETLLPFLI